MASRARWAALLSYLLVLALAAWVIWELASVHRAPLPRDELAAISRLKDSVPWARPTVRVTSLASAFAAEGEREAFVASLRSSLAADAVDVATAGGSPEVAQLSACTTTEAFSAEACLERMSEEVGGPAHAVLQGSYDLVVSPSAEPCPLLLLDAKRGAVLRWRLGGDVPTAADLGAAVAARLRETWFRQARLDQDAPLFEVAPAYVYSFLLVGDCTHRVAWDFRRSVLTPFLRRFLDRLRLLVDFDMDSQVVQCGSLGSSSTRVTAAHLREQFLLHAGNWPGDTVTRGAKWLPPLVRFVAFKPSSPLELVDEQGQLRDSFAVQGWGAVAVVGSGNASAGEACGRAPPAACDAGAGAQVLSACQARQAAAAWVSSLRSWLTLPFDGPLPAKEVIHDGTCSGLAVMAAAPRLEGIADWEVVVVARSLHRVLLRRTVETLSNLIELVDSLPDVVVREEIGHIVFEAAAEAARSAEAASATPSADLPAALVAARRSLALALAAQHDDTVVAQLYFPTEFKYAVYLPILVPIAMPILLTLFRQLKGVKSRSAALRAKAAKAGEGSEEQPVDEVS